MKTFLLVMTAVLLVASPTFANDAEKAAKLAEASGLTVDQIMAMRVGTSTETWVDTDGDGVRDTLVVVAGEPMGWGEIAKALGLPPSVLGSGNGKKK